MKKRILSTLMVLAMLFSMVPTTVLAAGYELTSTLDLRTQSSDTSGDGWSWTYSNLTLSITEDLTVTSGAANGIRLPAGATLDVAAEKTLTVNQTVDGSSATGGIICDGDLTITGSGYIDINIDCQYTDGIRTTGALTITGNEIDILMLTTGFAKGDAIDTTNLTVSGTASVSGNYRFYPTGTVTAETGTLNGVAYYNSTYYVYGDMVVNADKTGAGSGVVWYDAAWDFTSATSLTIDSDCEFDVSGSSASVDWGTASIINNGTLLMKSGTTSQDIAAMNITGNGVVDVDGTEYSNDGGDPPDGSLQIDSDGTITQGSGYIDDTDVTYSNGTLTINADVTIDSESTGILSTTDLNIVLANDAKLTIQADEDGINVTGNLTITGDGSVATFCYGSDIEITGTLNIGENVTFDAFWGYVTAASATIDGDYDGFVFVPKDGYDQEVIVYGLATVWENLTWTDTYLSFADTDATLTINRGNSLNMADGVFAAATAAPNSITNNGTFYFPTYFVVNDVQVSETSLDIVTAFVTGTGTIVLNGMYYDCDGEVLTTFGSLDFDSMFSTDNEYFEWNAATGNLEILQDINIETSGTGITYTGNLTVTGTGKVTIVAEDNGIFVDGNFSNTDVAWDIQSTDAAAIFVDGTADIDCDDLRADSVNVYGIQATGALSLTTDGTMNLSAENEVIHNYGQTTTISGTGTVNLTGDDDLSLGAASVVVNQGVTLNSLVGQMQVSSSFTNNGTTNAAVYNSGATIIYGDVTADAGLLCFGGSLAFDTGATLTVDEGVTVNLTSYTLDYTTATTGTIINNGTIVLNTAPDSYDYFTGTGLLSINGATSGNDGLADYSVITGTLDLSVFDSNEENTSYTWDATTSTLTVLSGGLTINADDNGIALIDAAVTINLIGDLTINAGDHGIWGDDTFVEATNGVTITGDGSLTINAGEDGIYVESGSVTVEDAILVIDSCDEGIYANDGLTLNNATITVTSEDDGIYTSDGNVNITSCTITVDSGDEGIYANDGDVTIDGSIVTATADYCAIDAADNVVIENGSEVIIISGYYGIYTDDKGLTIDGSDVTVTAVENGVYVYEQVNIQNGAIVTITSDYCGIYTDSSTDGDVTIDNAQLEITGDDYGIYSCADVTIQNSATVTASGDDYGIYSGADVTIQNSTTVTASGDDYGIYADDNLTINNSTVTATGDYCIYTCDYDIAITSSTIYITTISEGIYAPCGTLTIDGSTITDYGTSAGWYALEADGALTIKGNSVVTSDAVYLVYTYGELVSIEDTAVVTGNLVWTDENTSGVSVASTATLNAIHCYDDASNNGCNVIYGNVVVSDSKMFTDAYLSFTDDSTLTVSDGTIVNLIDYTITWDDANITVNGTLILPEGTDIATALGYIDGTGVVGVVDGDSILYYDANGTGDDTSDFTSTGALDFTDGSTPATGTGYSWEGNTLTITADGLNIISTGYGITLPADATIILNGDLTIFSAEDSIYCEGAFTIGDDTALSAASLSVTSSYWQGIQSTGDLTIQNIGDITIDAYEEAVYADGGNLTIDNVGVITITGWDYAFSANDGSGYISISNTGDITMDVGDDHFYGDTITLDNVNLVISGSVSVDGYIVATAHTIAATATYDLTTDTLTYTEPTVYHNGFTINGATVEIPGEFYYYLDDSYYQEDELEDKIGDFYASGAFDGDSETIDVEYVAYEYEGYDGTVYDTLTVTFTEAQAPATPVITATAGDGQVTISWSAPEDNGYAITGYTLSVGSDSYDLANTATSYTATGLTNGTEYSFVLGATNAGGTSYSAAVTATPVASTAGGGGSSSSSSSSSSSTTTGDTTTNDDGSVTSSATTSTSTSGSTTTATVTDKNMETAIETAVNEAGDETAHVEIPVTTKSNTDTVQATVSTEALQALADSAVESLTVTSDIGTVTIPSDAVADMVSQAQGDEITIIVSHVEGDDLTDAQASIIGEGIVVDLTVMSGDTVISSFGGHQITVSIPYELQDGESAENIVVWYIADDGTITPMDTTYDEETGMATFTTTHFSVFTVVHDDNVFADVDVNAYYYDAVLWAVENAVTSGTTDTTFSPNNICSRDQAVTFLYRAVGEPDVDGDSDFTDVAADAYYYDAVLWAVANGITAGTGDNTFSPDAICTRAQIVTFLYRLAGEPKVTSDCDFTDVDADGYYYDAVLWAVSEGITSGTTTTTFSPDKDCTRAEIVTFLCRNMAD